MNTIPASNMSCDESLNFGLEFDEPLILEQIIVACFKNPNRKKFPGFLVDRQFGDNFPLCEENEAAEYWISRISP